MSDQLVPQPRTDNIGNLANRVVGDDSNPPDFSAAGPLFDALLEEGDVVTAMNLRRDLAGMLNFTQQEPDLTDPRTRQRIVRQMQNGLHAVLSPALFDFNSVCGVLSALVDQCSRKEEVQTGKMQLETVRMKVRENTRVGNRVLIDESRSGIVMSAPDANGFADVVPMEEDYDGPMTWGYGQMPAGMPPPRIRRW